MLKRILFSLILLLSTSTVFSQDAAQTEGMFLRGKQVMYAKRGIINLMRTDQELSTGAVLTTMGKLTLANGTVTHFEKGLLYNYDGIKTGSVSEYVTVKNARTVIMTNEIVSEVDGYKFDNGETIDKSGMLGSGELLKEGEKIDLEGNRIK
jgi:hypothetical protein